MSAVVQTRKKHVRFAKCNQYYTESTYKEVQSYSQQ